MPTADYSSYHQPNSTGADGTKFDNFIDAVQATVNGLDTNNLAAGAGIKGSQLATGLNGPPGYEFAYNEFTATVNLTATSEATATTIVTASAVTFDGATPVLIEAWFPFADQGTPSTAFTLYDGASSIGTLQSIAAIQEGVSVKRRLTPSSAAHTYSVRGWVPAGTGHAYAGVGGVGNMLPGFIRITKV